MTTETLPPCFSVPPLEEILRELAEERAGSSATKERLLPLRRWTRDEYERLVEQGFFQPEERLELVDGIIIERKAQSRLHARGILLAQDALRSVFAEGFVIRPQMPLALGFDSEPEPDLAVVTGTPWDYPDAHPSTAILIVEVSDGSFFLDRHKASLYARAGIPEYWVENLVDWCLEVYREPKNGVYTSRTVLHAGDSVSPLFRPEAVIPIKSLLPRK
jgi:Uma2 family endonuclease